MARRMRRYRRTTRRTEGPDRAWLLTDFIIDIPIVDIPPEELVPNYAVPLMTFDDITVDEANLSREKSDWFCQRMLIDWIPNMEALEQADTRYSKLYSSMLFTMNNRLAETTNISPLQDIVIDGVYNRAARVLQTGVHPVHAHWNPVISIAQDGELQTSGGNPGAAQVGLAVAPWLGKEHVHIDIKPKFGLREDQNLYLGVCPWQKPDLWPEANVLTVLGTAKLLVQRKRAR